MHGPEASTFWLFLGWTFDDRQKEEYEVVWGGFDWGGDWDNATLSREAAKGALFMGARGAAEFGYRWEGGMFK